LNECSSSEKALVKALSQNLEVKMKKKLIVSYAMALLAICFLVNLVSAQKFEVRENGKITATVNNERTEQVRTLTISREGQPTHIYRSYPFVSAFSLSIGKDQVLTYYSKTRQIDLKASTFSLADVNMETANYGRDDVKTLYQQVSDDMRILRTVREAMPSVRLFETGLVLLTGEKSFLEGEASESLKVVKDVAFVKASSNAQLTLEGCNARCQGTEQRCIKSANGNQTAISACYSDSFRCQENCERTYAPVGLLQSQAMIG
jgi:hypothetical protein